MFSIVILSKLAVNANRCVAAIRNRESFLPPHRIIIVDDGARESADGNCAGVTWLDGVKPFVFARNANIGLTHAFDVQKSDSVILLNDDAVLKTRNGFTRLIDQQRVYEKYGILSAATNVVGNPNQVNHLSCLIRPESRMLCFVCVAITRDAWNRTGPLDEQFTGYGFDDDDYCKRALLAGVRLGVYDGCFVDHGRLTSTFRGKTYPLEGFQLNAALFRQKWGVDNHGNS